MEILERTLLFVVAMVPTVTAFGYFFGPMPYLQTSQLLFDPLTGLVDRRDSLILVGWFAIAAISSIFAFWQIFQKGKSEVVPAFRSKRLHKSFAIGLLLILVFNLLIDLDDQDTGNVTSFTIREVLIATVFWLIVGFVWFRSRNYTYLFRSIITCGLLFRPLSVFIQTPSSLLDEWHFNFTANEIAAPAAGMIPMVNFVPWYTNLLGFPIAPILRLVPGETVLVILVWLIFLQAICLALPAFIAFKIVGKHAALLSFLVMISLMTAQPSINGYFQAFPIRTIFPCLLLGLLVSCVQHIQNFKFWSSMFLGLLSGLALLNNLESGVPSLLALIFTLVLLYRSIWNFTRAVLSILFGVLLVFGSLGFLVLLTDKTFHFGYLFIPLKIVVSGGFFQEPMAVGGFHNIFAIFFVSGMAMSSLLFCRAQKVNSVSLKRIAALMSFSSSWGLIGLVYFSGRSFTSTLLAGSTYALGLLAVSVMLWIFADKQFLFDVLRLKTKSFYITPSLVIFLFFFIATTVLTRMDTINVLRQAGTEWDVEKSRTFNLKSIDEEINRLQKINQIRSHQVAQIFQLSNIMELTTGIEAGLVVADPRYLSMFREFQSIQCQYTLDSNFKIIIEDSQLDDFFGVFTDDNPDGSLRDLPFCNKSMSLSYIPTLDPDAITRLLKVDAKEE